MFLSEVIVVVRVVAKREVAENAGMVAALTDLPVTISLSCQPALPVGVEHRFHLECLAREPIQRRRCPMCRSPFSPADAAVLDVERDRAVGGDRIRQVAGEMQARLDLDARRTADWDAARAFEPQAQPPALPVALWQPMHGEWEAAQAFSALECVMSPWSHLQSVPMEFRVDWARAHVDVFREWRDATAAGSVVRVDIALRWYLLLPDVLLRGRRRGGRRGQALIAARFEAWRRGQRRWLIEELTVDRARESRRARERARQGRRRHERVETVERVHELIQEGQLARAARLLRSSGVCDVTPELLEQLRRKHPARVHPIPDDLDMWGHFRRPTSRLLRPSGISAVTLRVDVQADVASI